MSKGEMLRVLVKQRLTAAAEEIFGLFEQTIAEYEEELSFSREVNEQQQKLLDGFLNANDRAEKEESPEDIQPQPMVPEDIQPMIHQEVNTEPQQCSPNLDQEDPDLILVKVEQEELCISRDREYKSLRELLEADTTTTLARLKSAAGAKPQPSTLQLRQSDQNGVDVDRVDWAGSEPAVSPNPDSYLQPLSDDQTDDSSVLYDADWKKAPDSDNKDSDSDWTEMKDVDSASDTDSDEGWKLRRENKSHLNKKTKPPRKSSSGRMKTDAKLGQVTHKESVDSNSSVEKHEDVGTGDKPFGCSLCDTRFTDASTLLRHMTSHTPCAGDKKAPDADGDVKKNHDVTVSNRTGHKKLFNCSVCSKTFKWKSYLKRHMEAHSGNKTSRCSICGTRFPDHQSLRSHMARHSGERPYSCSVCHKSFKRKSYIRGHMKIHSKDLSSSVSDTVNSTHPGIDKT